MRPQAGRRRPILVAAGALALVVLLLVALAAGTSGRIAPGPLSHDGVTSLQILADAPAGTSPRVQAVAVATIVSALRTDPAVAAARPGRGTGTSSIISVRLGVSGVDDAERALARVQSEVDPGPLQLRYSALPLVLEDAQSSVQGQLGRLELLVAPFAILILVAAAGVRGGALAALAGAIALAGALAALRLTDGYLVAFAPAAAIGIAHAIELAALLRALHREEASAAGGGDPVERAIYGWSRPALTASAVRVLAPAALLVTPFAEAGSIAVAAGVATLLALASVALLGPRMLRLRATGLGDPMTEGGAGRAIRAAPRVLARSRLVLAAVLLVVVAGSVALAVPVRDAASSPLAAQDLPAGSPARASAAALAGAEPAEHAQTAGHAADAEDPLPDLVVAAALLALVVGLAVPAGNSRRFAAFLSLLPASATLGLLVLAVQQGHLAQEVTGSRSSLVQGVVVACVAAVAAISAGRTVLAASLTRARARSGAGTVGAAELSAGLTMPSIVASTLVVAGAFAALAGADLHAARALGLGVAAGVLLDLVLIRPAFLAVLARWGE
jgi:hypothetical protein